MEILIIKLSAIGDVVHTLPALEALHRHFPEDNITWVIEEKASGIIRNHPYLKRVIVSQRKKWLKDLKKPSRWYPTLKEIMHFLGELRSQYYDVIIDFQGLLKSGLIVFLSRGKRKIGYGKTREMSSLFLNEKVPPTPSTQHAVLRNLDLVRRVGAEFKKVNFSIFISEEDRESVRHFLAAHKLLYSKPLMVLHVKAGWMTKEWIPVKMAKLSDRLIERYGAQLIFTGGSEDHASLETVLSLMRRPAVNAAGKTTLTQLAYLLSRSHLMITVDSGPMHIASAVKAPLVALFGPTAPWKTGPYENGAIVVRSQLPCSPCFKKKCESRACMESISVDAVLEAVDTQLRRVGNTGINQGGIQ